MVLRWPPLAEQWHMFGKLDLLCFAAFIFTVVSLKSKQIFAKTLSATLGSISGAYLKTSSRLIERMSNTDFVNKYLSSSDVKSLFISVPVSMELVKYVTKNTDC